MITLTRQYSIEALEFARRAHSGQFRNDGKMPYIEHPITVAKLAVEIYLDEWESMELDHSANIERIRSIAYLHDVLEDCDVDSIALGFMLSRLDGITSKDSETILRAVVTLSRRTKETPILNYLEGIKGNRYARIVKLADLKHNLSDLKAGNLRDKYHLCANFLL